MDGLVYTSQFLRYTSNWPNYFNGLINMYISLSIYPVYPFYDAVFTLRFVTIKLIIIWLSKELIKSTVYY